MIWQTLRFTFPTWSDWSVSLTPQGLRRRRVRLVAKLFGFLTLIIGFVYLKRTSVREVTELKGKLWEFIAASLLKAKGFVF